MHTVNLLGHIDGLFRYAVVLSRNPGEAEDLVQETYVRAAKKISSLRPDSNVKAWLFTILRNLWLNELRKRRTGPAIVPIEAAEQTSHVEDENSLDPHAAHVRALDQERVRRAIDQLPEHFREVIVLREFEEMSYQEIATMLKHPVGTVMSRLARARAHLRSLLSPADEILPARQGTSAA
jgi:RNA polymerase sigma-70 factor (ECF subfamily)